MILHLDIISIILVLRVWWHSRIQPIWYRESPLLLVNKVSSSFDSTMGKYLWHIKRRPFWEAHFWELAREMGWIRNLMLISQKWCDFDAALPLEVIKVRRNIGENERMPPRIRLTLREGQVMILVSYWLTMCCRLWQEGGRDTQAHYRAPSPNIQLVAGRSLRSGGEVCSWCSSAENRLGCLLICFFIYAWVLNHWVSRCRFVLVGMVIANTIELGVPAKWLRFTCA